MHNQNVSIYLLVASKTPSRASILHESSVFKLLFRIIQSFSLQNKRKIETKSKIHAYENHFFMRKKNETKYEEKSLKVVIFFYTSSLIF